MTSLRTLGPGSNARVVQVGGERGFRRRLMELGLLPGTDVRVVRRVDVGGLVELEVQDPGRRLSAAPHRYALPWR